MGKYNEKLYRDIPLFSTDLNIPWTPLIFSKKLHICSVKSRTEVILDMIQIHVYHVVAVYVFIPRPVGMAYCNLFLPVL